MVISYSKPPNQQKSYGAAGDAWVRWPAAASLGDSLGAAMTSRGEPAEDGDGSAGGFSSDPQSYGWFINDEYKGWYYYYKWFIALTWENWWYPWLNNYYHNWGYPKLIWETPECSQRQLQRQTNQFRRQRSIPEGSTRPDTIDVSPSTTPAKDFANQWFTLSKKWNDLPSKPMEFT